MPSYSNSFKENIVKKVTSPGGPNALSLSKEINIPYGTICRWVKAFGSGQMSKNQAKVNHRNPNEKLALINEYHSLSGDAIGHFLRREGLTDSHITLWKMEFIEALSPDTNTKGKSEKIALQNQIKLLQKDLHRKNKALAETTALLVLKKKLDLLFGEDEE